MRYRPANGTEGESFVGRWCALCACDEVANGSAALDEGQTCPILNDSYACKEGVMQWVQDDGHAEPHCTAFVEHTGQGWVDPFEAERDRVRYEALPRDPTTGRPTI